MTCCNINVTFEEEKNFDCSFNDEQQFVCDFDGIAVADYTGSYTVDPSQQTQVLPTMNRTLNQNIIINPLPSYYGLITWDGSTLTVS